MLNTVIIMGRLVATPELKTTQSGTHVTRFTVASERDFKSNGEKKTDFIDCVAWRGTADFITKYFFKGKPILIKGMLTTDTWTDRDGNKRKSVEILVDSADFCGGERVGGPTEVRSNEPDVFEQADTDIVDITDVNDDDLPWED